MHAKDDDDDIKKQRRRRHGFKAYRADRQLRRADALLAADDISSSAITGGSLSMGSETNLSHVWQVGPCFSYSAPSLHSSPLLTSLSQSQGANEPGSRHPFFRQSPALKTAARRFSARRLSLSLSHLRRHSNILSESEDPRFVFFRSLPFFA